MYSIHIEEIGGKKRRYYRQKDVMINAMDVLGIVEFDYMDRRSFFLFKTIWEWEGFYCSSAIQFFSSCSGSFFQSFRFVVDVRKWCDFIGYGSSELD